MPIGTKHRWLPTIMGTVTFVILLAPLSRLGELLGAGILWVAQQLGGLPPTPGGTALVGGFDFPEPPLWLDAVAAIVMIPFFLVPLWSGLYVYHRLAFGDGIFDRRTLCGHCGHHLRTLVEPRCPACNRPI